MAIIRITDKSYATLDATKLSGALPAIAGGSLTGIEAISEIDVWSVTADQSNFTTVGVQNNSMIARHTGANFTYKGTGMTLVHATHFTFPSTGYWYVSLRAQWRFEGSTNARGVGCRIDRSTNAGGSWEDNYGLDQGAQTSYSSDNGYISTDANCIFEVDDISQVFVRGHYVGSPASSSIDMAHDDVDQSSGWTFIKLRGL